MSYGRLSLFAFERNVNIFALTEAASFAFRHHSLGGAQHSVHSIVKYFLAEHIIKWT